MRPVQFCSIVLSLSLSACGNRSNLSRPAAAPSPAANISHLVPAELKYAEEFVQGLSKSGWSIQAVQPSKFNGFFRETKKAAFITTDKGILEVVFFDNNSAVEQIQIIEQASNVAGSYEYVIKSAASTQKIGGGVTYFTKYRNMFIITLNRNLNDLLQQTLTD